MALRKLSSSGATSRSASSNCGVVGIVGESQLAQTPLLPDRLKSLYPLVNEAETPLPRSWSPKDKFNFIGLSQGNLRVHYKGHGKGHKDAASVRACHPVPSACGIFYFEVKIISKGRDGYMGIGLSAAGVNMNRLPGWDKHSYGYHGDDGHSFCSSGTGQPYGPTFTTGDIIGCGINLLDNTCFYTKNGHHLGIAFTDLPANLYPTVGLQTPGEIVDANFGQQPFAFDIEDMMKEFRAKTRVTVQKYVIPDSLNRNWEGIMNKMVMSYLVHHGYCSTAEAFAKTCGQIVAEDLVSMQNRRKIQRLVLDGRIPEAEEETKILYPTLLQDNPDLLFMLRCRHFVELVGQSMSTKCKTVEDHSTKACNGATWNKDNGEDMDISYTNGYQNGCNEEMEIEIVPSSTKKPIPTSSSNSSLHSEPESCNGDTSNGHSCNGTITSENFANGNSADAEAYKKSKAAHQNQTSTTANGFSGVEHLLQVGRELQSLSITMKRLYGHSDTNQNLLENAFSLLAYADPWNSPVGWQLSSRQREPVCFALNSAILQSIQLPRTPPLQVALNHAHLLLAQQARAGLGACAFVDLDMQADIK